MNLIKTPRTLSVKTKRESQGLYEKMPWCFGSVLVAVLGLVSVSHVSAQTPELSAATAHTPKKIVPSDPVGQLFNDGPRVVYKQDPGADPIEKLFWDRELKKEQAKALRDSGSAEVQYPKEELPEKSTPQVNSEPVSSKSSPPDSTAAPSSTVSKQGATNKKIKQQTQSDQPSQEVRQERKKNNSVAAPRNNEPTKYQPAKQVTDSEVRTVRQQATHAPDAGKVDGVAINSAAWPIDAKPKNAYGKAGPEGRPWQGLVFAAPTGTPVKAIDSGRVMYAHEFKNYGNLVIVDHGDRVASVYANNQRLLVKEGEQVGTGDVIALAGQTGSLDYPALYFELRKEGKPVDPLLFLKRRW